MGEVPDYLTDSVTGCDSKIEEVASKGLRRKALFLTFGGLMTD